MNVNLRKSFGGKILALTLASVLVPISIVGIFSYVNQRQSIEEDLSVVLSLVAKESANQVNIWLNQRNDYIHAMLQKKVVQQEFFTLLDLLAAHGDVEANRQESSQRIAAILEGYYWIEKMWISDPKTGKILLSTNADDLGKTSPGIEALRERLIKKPNQLMPIFVAEKDPLMLFPCPVMDGNEMKGIATFQVPMSDLAKKLIGDKKYIHHVSFSSLDRYLVNPDGFFLTPSAFEKSLIDEQRIRQRSEFELTARVPQTGEWTYAFAQARRILANEQNVPESNMRGYRDYRNKMVMGAWAHVPETDWFVIAEIDQSDAFAPLRQTLWIILSTVTGIGILAALMAGWFSRRLALPLERLMRVASKLAEGDWSATVDIHRDDEIGKLAEVFTIFIATNKELINAAVAISQGNFAAPITVRSENDALGNSLQQMTRMLTGISNQMNRIAQGDYSVEVSVLGEQDAFGKSLQQMTVALRDNQRRTAEQNWLKDGLNQLTGRLAGDVGLIDACQRATSFAARYVEAGQGALFLYDREQQHLKLYGTFAFIERNALSNTYKIGEGVIGQVALERLPILLKHIPSHNTTITTGTSSKPPLNTYTFPLLYNDELYGVIELASFEVFTPIKQQFLMEANTTIATALFSTIQRERVQELLRVSQHATQEAEQAAKEAEHAKEEAQRQSDEVQEANARLEEQQQRLQQQSEELRQVNAHLEEQQQQLQQQSEELRQQNEKLNQTKNELDKRAQDLELASKYKSEFLANMSHELRTPLNSIILLSKMLSRNEKKNLDAKDVKQVTVIHQAGEELLRLINDILDLSKIEAGKVTMNVTEFLSDDLFETFRDLFRSIAEEKGLEFIIRDELNAILKTDRDKLSQVIRNLLANAFKFTKKGAVTLLVAPAKTQPEMVEFSVIDTGVGIPKEKRQIVFEAFQQADGSISREYGGTGLGLSIAREYVKLLRGKLTLESEIGKGSTFKVALPLVFEETTVAEKSAPPKDNTQEQARSAESVAATNTFVPTPKLEPMVKAKPIMTVVETIDDDRNTLTPADKVILIVEDNADLAQSTMDITREKGFKVLVALNGREGLKLAAQYRPTGILLDLVLPDINGMEVLRELKSTRELRHIPVHIMSSRERDNSFRKSGAIGYFQKPVNDLDIQRAIENLMAVSQKYPKRLLIVEDDENQREAIKDLLSSSDGVEITGVGTQEDAIAEIKKGEYDAAIIDLGLRGGSGYVICQYIKEHNLALPIIIYTGRELTEDEERQLRKYTDSIIIKTAKSYERLSDEAALFLHQMYHGEQETTPAKPAPPRPLESAGSLEGKKIMIVDDDVKNVFVLASALENHGAIVTDAKNGEAALEQLRNEPDVDLVLMDIMMPVMDGYTAIQQIRKDPQLRHLPVIALTAKALKGDRQKCIQAGADDYLSKPVDYDGLIRLAKAWIEKGK